MTTEAATSVLSARCTPGFLAQIDAQAQITGVKRGEWIVSTLGLALAGRIGEGKKPTKANILDAMTQIGPGTCPEIAEYLGCSANQVAKRMGEMNRQGRVYPEGKRSSAETGKPLDVWYASAAERYQDNPKGD